MDNRLIIESSAISDRGLSEKRPENEDSFLQIAASGIFAVADGVGGAKAGEVASQMAVEILGEAFANRTASSDPERTMRSALEQANSSIHQMSNELENLSRMATTVVALHLENNVATVGHVGDSRLYRLSPDGTLHRETDDHSVVAEEVRAGRMTEEQAENHPGKNIISRALGAESFVEIDLHTRLVKPGSTFMLCSDGVTRHIGDAEIGRLLSLAGPTDAICRQIKDICYERGAEDNLTAVVVRLIDAPEQNPAMKNSVDTSKDFLSVPDLEETTIAAPRPAGGDEDLLGLEGPPTQPHQAGDREPAAPAVEYQPAAADIAPSTEPSAVPSRSSAQMAPPFAPAAADGSRAVLGLVTAALISGIVLGLLGYYLFLRMAAPGTASVAGIQTASVPNAFEENRRDVDNDPALYLSRNNAPQDAEDFYLVGRANLLLGDYPKARAALIESRNRLTGADPANVRVLADDLAILIAVTNNTTVQTSLKNEINAARSGVNSNTATTSTP